MNNTDIEILLNSMPLNVYWKNRNGEYLNCNIAQAHFFGLRDPAQVIGKTDTELLNNPALTKNWIENDQKVLASGAPLVIEETTMINNKKITGLSCKIPFKNSAGHVDGIMGITIDITEQKNAEEKLKEEKHNTDIALQNIIARLPSHVYWLNKENKYLGCNELQAESLGLKNAREIIGKSNEELSWSNQAQVLNTINDRVMATNQEYVEEETAQTADGMQRVFLSRKIPLLDENQNVTGVLGISFDITDRKKIEQDLLAAKNAAEAANRAKTDFLANMSHDMKTPLSGIVTTAEVIAHDQSAREIDRQFAAMISASGKQLSSFFTSCLDLSKLEMEEWASTKSVFSVRQLVHDIHDLYLPKAKGSGLSLSVIYDPNLPKAVEGHHDSLYRALLNLTGNALKFTEKGSVTLRAFCGEKIDTEHTTIVFEVEDTGIGIPEDKFKIIFEKLQRLTPSYSSNIEGSGIGLYIVDQFIKRMGGTIQVKSEVGKGSKFTVSIPMRIAHTAPAHKPSAPLTPDAIMPTVTMPEPSTPINNDSPRVLLVEDVPIIQIATKSLLNGAGFYVDTASSGQEALDLCASGDYGVIYMDIGLPDMQGHEAAQLIRQQEKAAGKTPTPIIALTGHGAVDVQSFCENAGMQGVLSKPLLREQAEGIWRRYIHHDTVMIPNFMMLEEDKVPPVALNFPATVAVLGSEQRAKDTIAALQKELENNYIPKITALVQKNDRAKLRFILHQLMGCLTYVIFPPLQQAVADLHQAVRDDADSLEEAYHRFMIEAIKAKDVVIA